MACLRSWLRLLKNCVYKLRRCFAIFCDEYFWLVSHSNAVLYSDCIVLSFEFGRYSLELPLYFLTPISFTNVVARQQCRRFVWVEGCFAYSSLGFFPINLQCRHKCYIVYYSSIKHASWLIFPSVTIKSLAQSTQRESVMSLFFQNAVQPHWGVIQWQS